MYNNAAVVIPALNEAASIEAVVSDALLVCGQVYVVDDGSIDNTGILAAKNGAEVLRNPTTKGLGAALRRGPRAPDIMRERLEEISIHIASGALVAVRCGLQLYVMHPLENRQLRAFQQQNAWYDSRIPAKDVISP